MSKSLGDVLASINQDELVYLFLMACTILVGYAGRFVPPGELRYGLYGTLGVVATVTLSRTYFLLILLMFVGNYLILRTLRPAAIQISSFVFCFGVLGTVRLGILWGWWEFNEFANVVILLVTLRIICSSYEISDLSTLVKPHNVDKYWSTQRGSSQLVVRAGLAPLKDKFDSHFVPLHFLKLLSYTFSFVGLFSGPFYTFRSYRHMIDRSNFASIPIWPNFRGRIKRLVIMCPLYIALGSVFTSQYQMTRSFLESPFLLKYLYASGLFAVFRLRFYVGWTIADLSCVTSGVGAYPKASLPKNGFGPTRFGLEEGEVDFETVRSLDIYNCEFASTVKESLVSWNKTVQWWLFYTVYSRFKFLRRFVTTFVSCFWHGIHPGYYLGILFSPFCVVTELFVVSPALKVIPPSYHHVFHWVMWLNRISQFVFMSSAFILQRADHILAVWSSVHYFGIYLLFLLLLSGALFRLMSPN